MNHPLGAVLGIPTPLQKNKINLWKAEFIYLWKIGLSWPSPGPNWAVQGTGAPRGRKSHPCPKGQPPSVHHSHIQDKDVAQRQSKKTGAFLKMLDPASPVIKKQNPCQDQARDLHFHPLPPCSTLFHSSSTLLEGSEKCQEKLWELS